MKGKKIMEGYFIGLIILVLEFKLIEEFHNEIIIFLEDYL